MFWLLLMLWGFQIQYIVCVVDVESVLLLLYVWLCKIKSSGAVVHAPYDTYTPRPPRSASQVQRVYVQTTASLVQRVYVHHRVPSTEGLRPATAPQVQRVDNGRKCAGAAACTEAAGRGGKLRARLVLLSLLREHV